MMLVKRLVAVLAVVCCPAACLADVARLEIGGVYVYSHSSDFSGNWGDGVGVRVGLRLATRPTAALHLVLDATRHGFTGYNIVIMVPGIEGYRYQLTGEEMTRYTLSTTIRRYGIGAGGTVSSGYIWLQTGVSLVDRGRIEFRDWIVGEPDSDQTRLIGDSGDVDWAAHFGIGYGIPIGWWSGIRPVLEVGVRTTSDMDAPQFPLSLVVPLGGGRPAPPPN